MKQLRTLALLALLLGFVPLLPAQPPVGGEAPRAVPPPQAEKSIRLKVQVLRLAEAKLKENNGGKMPPKVFVVPASPESVANLLKIGAKVVAEPSLVTTDGRVASFLSGGEVAVPTPGKEPSHMDWLAFGTGLELLPRIQSDGRISLKFHFQQTDPTEDSPRDKLATALSGAVLTSGLVSEGAATLKEGESVFAHVPFAQSDNKDNGGDVLLMFLTPEITGEITTAPREVQPASVTPPKTPPFTVEDTQSKPARITLFKSADRMPGERHPDLVLEVSETGYLDCPETIREAVIQGGSKRMIDVKALGDSELSVQGVQVGTAMVVVIDKNGEEYSALIEVKPAKGASAVEDTLKRLFPDAQIEAITINESLLLRGSVTKEDDVKKITEIAEQFAPKVLNHLVVDDGLTATVEQLPPGMRFQRIYAILRTTDEANDNPLKDARYLKADVELEWMETVKGKPTRVFKPLLKGVAVVSIDRESNHASGSALPSPEAKTPAEDQFAQVALVVTPDQVGLLKLAGRGSLLRVTMTKPGLGRIPVAVVDPETESLLRKSMPAALPRSTSKNQPSSSSVEPAQEPSEIQALRSDVQALRQDVKRLIEILEKKTPKAPTSLVPYYEPAKTPTPSSLVPYYGDPATAPTPAKLAPPVPADGFNPYSPPPADKPNGPVSLPPKATSPETHVRIETKPLPNDLDPSAFVSVQTYKISAPEQLGDPVPTRFGSGVVIESEPGKAIILTAAHFLREFEAGKFVLHVGAGQFIEEDGKTRRVGGSYPATIILQDDKADIALLRAKVPVKLATISLARHSLPKTQDAIYCIGFPEDSKHSPKSVTAKVTTVNRLNGSENFDFAGFIPDGFNGGAVLDESWQLIGIALALNLELHQTVCTPAAEIRKLLAREK